MIINLFNNVSKLDELTTSYIENKVYEKLEERKKRDKYLYTIKPIGSHIYYGDYLKGNGVHATYLNEYRTESFNLFVQAEIDEDNTLISFTPHKRNIAITKKLNARGILTDRQCRRAFKDIDAKERPFSEYDYVADNGKVKSYDETISEPFQYEQKLSDYEYVLQNIEDQVLNAMLCKKRDRIPADLVLAYHLVYRRQLAKSEVAKRLGVSNATVTKYLELFFYEIALELYCGIEINDKTLEKFMHPSIIALKNARKKYSKKSGDIA